MSASLQEERFRVERLEEQINDLTELHQNEVENLKQNIIDMEEKVQYQSEERLRDIHDLLDSCHTRVSIIGFGFEIMLHSIIIMFPLYLLFSKTFAYFIHIYSFLTFVYLVDFILL